MLGGVYCNLRGHLIDRDRVWNDGLDFRTKCQRCGTPMIKIRRQWQEFDCEKHADLRRKPHPRYDQIDA